MSMDKPDIYFFTRNASETERLSRLHQILADNAGFVIHPLVMKHLTPGARVADVAAGSGVWTLDVARLLPATAQIIGYDNSAAQFPSTHPPNVSFETADAKQPFPAHLHGTFDLVHVRTLIAAMGPDDWATVVGNLVQLLKPGGHLHWSEADARHIRCLRGVPEYHPYASLRKLLALWERATGNRMTDGFPRLEDAMRRHPGLADVEVDAISTDRVPAHRALMTQIYVGAILGGIEKAGAMPAEALEGLRKGVEQDIENGGYMRADGVHFIARKV